MTLRRRLEGVLEQYGPEIALLTGDVVFGHTFYFAAPSGFDEKQGMVTCKDPSVPGTLDGLQRLRRDYPGETLRDAVLARLELGLWPMIVWRHEAARTAPLRRPSPLGLAFECEGGRVLHSRDARLLRGVDERAESALGVTFRLAHRNVPRIVPWIARTVSRWLKEEPHVRARAATAPRMEIPATWNPEWDAIVAQAPVMLSDKEIQSQAFSILFHYFDGMQILSERIVEIGDWARATRPNLLALSPKQVTWRRHLWEARLRRRSLLAHRPTSPVVFERDGYRVEHLTTPEALDYEGAAQQHCVGTYAPEVKKGFVEIYAIVDGAGQSQATIEVRISVSNVVVDPVGFRVEHPPPPPRLVRSVQQVRAKRNSPVKDKAVLAVLAAFCEERMIRPLVERRWAYQELPDGQLAVVMREAHE